MGLFKKTAAAASAAADAVASAAVRTGQKIAGNRGADTANRLTGSRLERCSQTCGHCNTRQH